jgi:pimeloyl-ACP methyl ester carboxylesterase
MNANSLTVPTQGGRTIHVIDAGPADGIPVLVHHGTPGSAVLYPPWVEDARARGLRLIGYDRPGYGGSSPHAGRTVGAAAQDVAAIAKTLGLKRLLSWGHSGGGPHALACAALLPDLVVAAAALSSPAPYWGDAQSWMAGMGEDNVHEFGAALESPEAVRKFVEAASPGMLNAHAASLAEALRSLLSAPDVAVLSEQVAGHMIRSVREGIQESRDGWVADDLAFTTPWGFDLEAIRMPVLLMHGEQDLMSPIHHGRWLAAKIAHADARFLPYDGHMTLFARRIPEVHAWLLDKWK